jgi:hypothetical protein
VKRQKKQLKLIFLKHEYYVAQAMEHNEHIFNVIDNAATKENIEIAPYVPEPRNLRQLMVCPPQIRDDWLKAVQKELWFIVENKTFKRGESPKPGNEIIPSIFIFKTKLTSKGYLDKLKARCVARGDLQAKPDLNDVWAPCIFSHTFRVFVSQATRRSRVIKQLDFIGAFCQGIMKRRLFLQLPQEYMNFFPEYKEYFESAQLMAKLIYGTDFAHRVFSDDLQEWVINNDEFPFVVSEVDPTLLLG